jgi:hypothetical protein
MNKVIKILEVFLVQDFSEGLFQNVFKIFALIN